MEEQDRFKTPPHYSHSLEDFDEIKRRATDMVAGADALVVFCGYVEPDGSYVLRMAGAIRNIPAPDLLSRVRRKLVQLERLAIEDWDAAQEGGE